MMMWLRKIIFLLLTMFLVSCSQNDPTFHDAQGQEISLSQLKGKWLIINYWADWCGSCIEEIPELNRFYEHNKDILIFGVNYDHPPIDELKKFVTKRNIKYPVFNEDPSQVWQFGVLGVVPTTFIINPEGRVVKTINGPTSEKSLLSMVHQLQK